jgi:threonine dehydrogenase-like Zn-dependent dehydrogenase
VTREESGRGENVLIIGASGGAGSFAVQIAKALGAEVSGVCSTAKVDMVRSLGADAVLDHTRTDFAEGGRRYDVVLDVGGNARLSPSPARPRPAGTAGHRRGRETEGRLLGGSSRQVRAQLLSPFVSQTLRTFPASENAADLIGVCCIQRDGGKRRVWRSAGHIASASSVNAVASRSGGGTSVASS